MTSNPTAMMNMEVAKLGRCEDDPVGAAKEAHRKKHEGERHIAIAGLHGLAALAFLGGDLASNMGGVLTIENPNEFTDLDYINMGDRRPRTNKYTPHTGEKQRRKNRLRAPQSSPLPATKENE